MSTSRWSSRLCLGLLVCALTTSMQAQEYLYELGGRLGIATYMGDASRTFPLGLYRPSLGLHGRYNSNFRWAWTSGLTYSRLGIDTRYSANTFPQGRDARLGANLMDFSIGGEFNFVPLSDKFRYLGTKSFSPYIGLGGGLSLAWAERVAVAPNAYIAVGMKYKLTARLSLEAQCKWQYLLTDRLDALSASSAWLDNPFTLNEGRIKGLDGVATLSIGLTYQMSLRRKNDCH